MASGEEIWEQTGGELDAVVAAQGTGGWISGVARALKAHDPAIRAYAVEPAECPLISEQRWGTHGVPGIGDGIIPPNLDLAAHGRHRDGVDRRGAGHGGAARPRGRAALRPVVGHQRGRRR